VVAPDRATGRSGVSDPSIIRFRAVIEAGLTALEARREEVNELNVFPVADGDTGDNMVLTLRAVVQELDRLASESEGRTIDEIGRDEIVASVARAALLGARGSSGVILSQLIRGAAEELASRPGELVDPALIGAALARAVDQAYGSVREPVEGTILTVVREMAHRVASDLAHTADARLDADTTTLEQDDVISHVIQRALDAGQASVQRGPDLLPVLRDSGVVDAGGYGLTVLLAGIVGGLRGGEAPEVEHHRVAARVSHPQHVSTTFRYCMNFAVSGTGLEQRRFTATLEQIGDSVLVVGDANTLKVHIHTDDPNAATAPFAATGIISHLDVADMTAQAQGRDERIDDRAQAVCAALAVVSDESMGPLFARLGARVLSAGPPPRPTTYDLLAAIHAVPAEEVVVVTDGAGVVAVVEHAAQLSDKAVIPVAARSGQVGLAAALRLNPSDSAAINAAAMRRTLEHVRTGAVKPAARDDADGRFRAGDAIGEVDERLVACGEPPETLREVLAQLSEGAELITCLCANGAPLDGQAVRALCSDQIEIELTDVGPASCWWLLSAE
jgi:DAK2 domain fusion protein YloV